MGHIFSLVELFCNSEIANFDLVVFSQKDVHGFNITMQNAEIVQIIESEAYFDEQSPNRVFIERLFVLRFDVLLEVTALAELHHNIDALTFIKAVIVFADVF